MAAGIGQLSEDEARTVIEGIRWPGGPQCPHCGSRNGVRLAGSSTRAGVLKCRDCKRQFTVTVNTIMHRSKVPLATWLAGFELMSSRRGQVTARELQRELGLGRYETAWHMVNRIRHTIRLGGLAATVNGTSEGNGRERANKPPRSAGRSYRAHDGSNPQGRTYLTGESRCQ